MNKQFSPFLQRYFLIITEVICNQVRKYRGIFKQIFPENSPSKASTAPETKVSFPLYTKDPKARCTKGSIASKAASNPSPTLASGNYTWSNR